MSPGQLLTQINASLTTARRALTLADQIQKALAQTSLPELPWRFTC